MQMDCSQTAYGDFNGRKRSRIEAGNSSYSPLKNQQTLDKKQQLLDGVAALNFDKIINDTTISEDNRAQIAQLTALLKLAAAIVGDSMAPQFDSAAEMERRRSVVATGLPESLSDIPSQRAREDNNTIISVLDQLGVECPVTAYRMGNRALNGPPRPLKVVLAASKFQRTALAHWNKKRIEIRQQMPGLERFNLRESLTPEQLVRRRELQKECTAKRTQTGQDWIIYNDELMRREDIKKKSLFPPTASLLSKTAEPNPKN